MPTKAQLTETLRIRDAELKRVYDSLLTFRPAHGIVGSNIPDRWRVTIPVELDQEANNMDLGHYDSYEDAVLAVRRILRIDVQEPVDL